MPDINRHPPRYSVARDGRLFQVWDGLAGAPVADLVDEELAGKVAAMLNIEAHAATGCRGCKAGLDALTTCWANRHQGAAG